MDISTPTLQKDQIAKIDTQVKEAKKTAIAIKTTNVLGEDIVVITR